MITYPIDRTGWPPGPWDQEADNAAWDLPNGLHAVIRRNPMGGWCGYVGVPPSHPWHKHSYNDKAKPDKALLNRRVDVNELSVISLFCASMSDDKPDRTGLRMDLAVRVHGGVTFAGRIPPEHQGRVDHWYFGFDCAHAGDSLPGLLQHLSNSYWDIVERHNVYRNESFVRSETAHLSEELLNLPLPCPEKHQPRRPKRNRTASPKPISTRSPMSKLPLPPRSASQKKKKYRKNSVALTVEIIKTISMSN